MLRSGRLQSRQVAGRARGAGLPAPGLAEGRAHCGANRVGACCGEGQGAEQAHLAGEEGRSSRSPMDQKTYNNRSGSRSGGSRNVHTPRKKGAHLAVWGTASQVAFPTTPGSHRWSYACALTRSVSGIAWARPDQGSRSATRRASWAHCRSCMRRNTRQPREQDVRHASTKRRFAQARSASFDIFAVDCGAKR